MMRRQSCMVGAAAYNSLVASRRHVSSGDGGEFDVFNIKSKVEELPGKKKASDDYGKPLKEVQPGVDATKYNEKGYIAYKGKVAGGTGKDNKPGVYEKPNEPAYFTKGELGTTNSRENSPKSPTWRDASDNIKVPEYRTAQGLFEHAGSAGTQTTGGVMGMRYQDMQPNVPKETVDTADMMDMISPNPLKDHHPDFDYTSKTGKKEGWNQGLHNIIGEMELRKAKMSLYRSCMKCLPLLKQFYWLDLTVDQLKDRMKDRFLINRFVRDEDAVRHLLYMGWIEYTDVISLKRPRGAIMKYFGSTESEYDLQKIYAEQEGRAIQDRAIWNGEEQKKEGVWDGHWSWHGREAAKEHARIAGRVPVSWKVSKGFFDKAIPDGTNAWEKSMDYEGWMQVNSNPDVVQVRKDEAPIVEGQNTMPKHYVSKNRRAYRRLVFDLESFFTETPEESWARSREIFFQQFIRDRSPETNRVDAERRLAKLDDEFFGKKHHETKKIERQVMREFPNPRMWKTDTFFFRWRQLSKDLELNWSRAPVGRKQEKLYNEWLTDNANYAIFNSRQYHDIKSDKTRNPMAKTWAEFYLDFDPDVPSTRNLPWYHADFDYDRRHNWDEYLVRQKKWATMGEVDARRPFFDAKIHQAQLEIHRDERVWDIENCHKKYISPRTVQLYRAFNRRLDVAMTEQLRDLVEKSSGKSSEALSKLSVEDVESLVAKTDFSKFKFQVPVFIYPDNYEQAKQFNLDGSEQRSAEASE